MPRPPHEWRACVSAARRRSSSCAARAAPSGCTTGSITVDYRDRPTSRTVPSAGRSSFTGASGIDTRTAAWRRRRRPMPHSGWQSLHAMRNEMRGRPRPCNDRAIVFSSSGNARLRMRPHCAIKFTSGNWKEDNYKAKERRQAADAEPPADAARAAEQHRC
jgi:hypothetical protein